MGPSRGHQAEVPSLRLMRHWTPPLTASRIGRRRSSCPWIPGHPLKSVSPGDVARSPPEDTTILGFVRVMVSALTIESEEDMEILQYDTPLKEALTVPIPPIQE